MRSRLNPGASPRRGWRAFGVPTACAAALVVAVATPARAQVSTVGSFADLMSFFVRGVDVAPDPNGGYLVVGAQNAVLGVCVNGSGSATGGVFTIKPSSDKFGAFARARYSSALNSGQGGFLVVWPEEQADHSLLVKSRVVSCSGPTAAEKTIDNGNPPWLESGAAIAYSATSQKFLVTWKGAPPDTRLKARVLDLTGAGVGAVLNLSSGFGRDPGIVWNPNTDDFGVSFSGETSTSAFSGFVRVPASNPSGFSRTTFNNIPGGLTTITDIDYNPQTRRYVMSWFEFPGALARIAEIDESGSVIANSVASSTLGSYDALSMSYNGTSGTFLLSGIDRVTDNLLLKQLNSRGVSITSETPVSGTSAARYPRVASSASTNRWHTAFSRNFTAASGQVLQTSATNGGGGGSGGGTSTPPPTSCTLSISPTSYSAPAAGTYGTISVSASASGCSWSASSAVNWIAVTLKSGSGSYSLGYWVQPNSTGQTRTGKVTVAGQTLTVTQSSTSNQLVFGHELISGAGSWLANVEGSDASFSALPWTKVAADDYAVHAAVGDIDGDGRDETVVGLSTGGWVGIFDDVSHDQANVKWFKVDWPSYVAANGAVFPAVGDLDGDGRAEIVLGFGTGGGGFIQILKPSVTFDGSKGIVSVSLSSVGWKQIPWSSYNASDGTTHPAIGDLDGDGKGEIAVGLGTGSGGWVAIMGSAAKGYAFSSWKQVAFTAYTTSNGMTWPAAGDIDGDGRAELVVGLGAGGGGWLAVWDDGAAGLKSLGWLRTNWSAYNNARGETHPAIGNLDDDAGAEIVIGLGKNPGDGGWFQIVDDSAHGYSSLGWQQLSWGAIQTSGGGLFPAVGYIK